MDWQQKFTFQASAFANERAELEGKLADRELDRDFANERAKLKGKLVDWEQKFTAQASAFAHERTESEGKLAHWEQVGVSQNS